MPTSTSVKPPTNTSVGTGPDSLVLKVSEDAYQGDAKYAVRVDGQQIGATFTATSLHSSGQSDILTLHGDWAAGSHQVAVSFLNDAYGGTSNTDRNLYLDSASYNGQALSGVAGGVAGNIATNFSFTEAAPPPTTSAPASLSAGTGPDSLVLKISEDVYQGNAQYTVSVDGKQVGGTFTASALHSSGQSDTLTLHGDWAAGSHQVAVSFLNDAWGGTDTTDRNLYLDGATYNGQALSGTAGSVAGNAATTFSFTDGTALPPSGTSPPPSGGTGGTAPAGAIVAHAGDNLQALVNAAPEGATFWLEAGDYRMQSVTPKNGQTFDGADGAVLDGSRLLTGFAQDGNGWVIGGQTQEGARNPDAGKQPGFERAGYPDAVFLDDAPLRPVATRAELAPGKFYFDYGADKIYIGDNPSGHKVEATVTPQAFGGGAQNVTLNHLTVEKYASPVQYAAIGGIDGVQGWSINDVTAQLNFGLGAKLGAGSHMTNSHMLNNGEMGAGGSGAGVVVENSEFGHNGGWAGIDPNAEGGGFKFAFTTDLVVRNSYSHDNIGNGMWTDMNNAHTLYEGNRVENNTDGGIFHEISYDAIIRNNTVTGNGAAMNTWVIGAGIGIANSQGVEVYGNTVDTRGGGQGITLADYDRSADAAAFNAPRPYDTINNNIHDNHVYGDGGNGASPTSDALAHGTKLWNGTNMFDGNDYHLSNTAESVFFWGNDHHSFAELQAVSPWEDHGSVSPLG